MHKILRKIKSFLFAPKTEIELVEAALNRYKFIIYDMNESAAEANACCAGCMYGSSYHDLCDKIERVEKWLIILKSRKAKIKE